MLRWRFNTFVHPHGRTEVQNDIDRLDDAGNASFDAAVRYLAGTTTPADWHEPQAKKLSGVEKIYEIRFKANRCATRALGFFGPGTDEFTILIIATHKQNVYNPHDAIATAVNRRQQVLDKTAKVAALKIDGEVFPPIEEN